jgi:hypothetical protein
MVTSVLDLVVFGLIDVPADVLVWRLDLADPSPSAEKLETLRDLELVLARMQGQYLHDVEHPETDEDEELMAFRHRMLRAIGDLLRALAERD